MARGRARRARRWATPTPNHFRPRPAYRFCLEDSIYLDAGAPRARASAALLLAELLAQCEARGARQMLAVIGDSANAGSVGVHRALRLRASGLFKAAGWKFGRWLDVVLMQRPLGDRRRQRSAATMRRDAALRVEDAGHLAGALGGSFGLHRFYLHGLRDCWAGCIRWPTLLGLCGMQRVHALRPGRSAAWLLIPLLGPDAGRRRMLCAIIYGLTPDERWDARFNPGAAARRTGWAPVLGVDARR